MRWTDEVDLAVNLKEPLGRRRSEMEDNIKMDLK
jgi:hypothetical protein